VAKDFLTPTPSDPACATSRKSISVLRFATRSNKDENLFLTDGIHDDLLTQLAKIHDLKVISRTSVMEYRDTSKNLRQIGAELTVGTILEEGMTIALSLAHLNRFSEAVALAEQLMRNIPYEKDSLVWGSLLTYQAMVKGLAGDQETAIYDLKIALETPATFGPTAWELHYDPNWDFMRDNPHSIELATPGKRVGTRRHIRPSQR